MDETIIKSLFIVFNCALYDVFHDSDFFFFNKKIQKHIFSAS